MFLLVYGSSFNFACNIFSCTLKKLYCIHHSLEDLVPEREDERFADKF